MVTNGALFGRDDWVKKGRANGNCLEPSLAAPTPKRVMNSQDGGPPSRKRESRSGTRRVTTLSAEQLERKRANDREAQRSIRQRTKEHIEQLEAQVSLLQAQITEMQSRSDQFQGIIQRNAALENEVDRLKRQLAYHGHHEIPTNSDQTARYRAEWAINEESGSTVSNITTADTFVPSSQFAGGSHSSSARLPRTTSAVSVSRQPPHLQDWQQYNTATRSSLDTTSATGFSGRVESYIIDGHMQQGARLAPPPSIAVATPQTSFHNNVPPNQKPDEASFQHMFPVDQGRRQPPENLQLSPHSTIDQVTSPFLPSQRSSGLSVPSINDTAQSTSNPSYQTSAPPYHSPLPSQRDQPYPYPWEQ
ncbi:hypothetical protein PENSTE_c008G01047 [Penicillium steckii]|uniref:BZIP domain-containing protein n=1 Tax=Penicillium steckii TaxID=303698 RepID=A0A1V6TB78_9EURO|nr:hypothetical protein PENSTE_c008G01047 [Penicillium steckii]